MDGEVIQAQKASFGRLFSFDQSSQSTELVLHIYEYCTKFKNNVKYS